MKKTEIAYQSILAIAMGFLVIHILTHRNVFLWISLGVGVAALLSKWLAGTLAWGWLRLASGLGFVMSKVMLSIVYYVFLVPIALLARLFRKKDELQLKSSSQDSLYHTRDHLYMPEDFEKGW
jgi:hypothetical protein